MGTKYTDLGWIQDYILGKIGAWVQRQAQGQPEITFSALVRVHICMASKRHEGTGFVSNTENFTC